MKKANVDRLVNEMMNPKQGELADEYRDELSYRFAQEARLRIQKQYSSVSDFAEKNGLDRHQISRQLSGTSNLTLKSIARIAAALKEPLMNVCGLPSYRFEEVGLPVFANTAKENRMLGFDPASYSNISQVIKVLSLGEEKTDDVLEVKSKISNFINFNSRHIEDIPFQKFEAVGDDQRQAA